MEWLRQEGGRVLRIASAVRQCKEDNYYLYLYWYTWPFKQHIGHIYSRNHIHPHVHTVDWKGIQPHAHITGGGKVYVNARMPEKVSPASVLSVRHQSDTADHELVQHCPAMLCKQHIRHIHSRNSGEINLQRTAFEVLFNSQVFTSLTMQFGLWGAALYSSYSSYPK